MLSPGISIVLENREQIVSCLGVTRSPSEEECSTLEREAAEQHSGNPVNRERGPGQEL